MRRLVALVVLPVFAACSLAVVNPPSANSAPDRPIVCSDSYVPPIVDTWLGLGSLAGAGTLAIAGADRQDTRSLLLLSTFPLVLGVLGVVSAVYGYTRVSRCRAVHARG